MSLNLGYAESYLENKLKFGQVRKKIIHKVENKHFLSRFVIRNRRRNVFPDSKIKRVPRIVEVHLTDKELKLYNHIHLYLAKIYSENFYSGQSGVGFVMVILQKLLTSSPPALIKSLKKRIRYLNENKQRIVDLTTRANLEDELTAEDSSLDINEGLEDYTLDEKYEIRNRSSKIGEQRRSTEFNIEKHIKILSKFLSQLQKLHQLGIDSKAKKLVKIVKKILQHNPDEKMIIFTQFKQTLYYLAELLREEHIDVSEFHGSLTESQKDRNIHHFKTKGTVLMSTEIGGEGRNFQFCHIIINYDLPWNPMRLEQRIGRIDRIGQTKDVYIYNFFIADTVESSIINAISERIRIFEESIGDLEPILGSLEKKITEIVLKKDEVPTKFKVDELVGETQEKIEEVFDQLDDFILDKKSLQYQRISKDVINPKMISDVDLKHYFRLFSKSNPHLLNMEIQERENTNTYMLEVSGGLRSDLLLKKKSYEGLFDFDFAVQNDEYEFFALGHELLMKLVDLTTNDNYGGFSSNISLKWSQIKKYFSNIHPVNFPKQEKEILHKIKNQQKPLYLFIFQVRFLGVIVEKMIIPIIISHKKNILKMLSKLIYRPHNFSSILNPPLKNMEEKKDPDRQMDQRESIRSGSKEKLHELYEKAQNYIKPLIQEKTKNLVEENKKAYLKKKRKLKNLKRQKTRYIKDHIEWARNELRAKKIKLPTERQIRNANKIKNEKKKKKRFAYFENIRKDVEYYENEVKRWEKELEDLEFDIPAKLKKLKSYKQLKINADLFSFARIFIENQESI